MSANAAISLEQQDLHGQIDELSKKIAALEDKLRAFDREFEGVSAQRQQYQLLEQICTSLDQLDALGSADLFWGERPPVGDVTAHLTRVRAVAAAFQEKSAAVDQKRKALCDRIHEETLALGFLHEELAEQQEREEQAKHEFVVEREIAPRPYRPMVMPWRGQAEDERRFRKSLLAALLLSLLFGYVTHLWVVPPRDTEVVEIPERLVQLVKKEPPKPPEQKQPEKKEELPKESKKATPKEKQQARAKAEKSGVLAFKNSFADLMEDAASLKLGADARVSNSGQKAVGDSQRSLIVAQAQAGSGGIRTSSLSRDVGGMGKQMGGVQFTRVESAVAGMKNNDRPLSSGPGPSRTDEEIQIVFDRYKAALYRLYNRELRNDPTLRGKMILRLTIEPNGTVSMCRVESTDLASPALSAEVVNRVKKFNFGPKEGVPKITILYPIDFLPAG